MKKITALLSLLLAFSMVVSLTGCGAKTDTDSSTPASQSSEITVTDHNGNTVTVAKNIQRIVVCDIYPLPSVLSIFFDSAKKIVGMAPASMAAAKNSLLSELYPEILGAQTGFIDGTNVNMEELIKLAPDVVFYSASSKELGQQLTAAGFKAIAISASGWGYNAIETLNNWIDLLSKLFPESDKSGVVKKYSKEVYDLVQKRVADIPDSERVKAFFLFNYSEAKIATSGNSFFGQWWADAIGAKNVGEELQIDNAAAVSMEQIYKWNPNLIFITNFTTAQSTDLYNNTIGNFDWSGIDAVKNKRVYKMPLGMYRSYTPGVDTPITLLYLAKTAYPDKFEDINISEKVQDYYKTVFGIRLTENQANSIFKPQSDAGANIK